VEVSYEYDHGDSWDHKITFLGKADSNLRKNMQIPAEEKMPVFCLGGEVCRPNILELEYVLIDLGRDIRVQKTAAARAGGHIEEMLQREERSGRAEGVVQTHVRKWGSEGLGSL